MNTEKKIILQAFERHGNMGVFWYGKEDSEEDTWTKCTSIYRKPTIRSKRECMDEQKRLLRLGVYEDFLN